jgi:hypothetical protein
MFIEILKFEYASKIEEILNARALENLIIIEQEKKKFAESYEETNQRNREELTAKLILSNRIYVILFQILAALLIFSMDLFSQGH